MESSQEGTLYENILLKLCLKSLRHNGELRLEDGTPCTPQSLAVVTRQQVGTVEWALFQLSALRSRCRMERGT